MSEPLAQGCWLCTLGRASIRTGARTLGRCCPYIPRPGEDGRGLGGFSKGKVRTGKTYKHGR